MPSTAPAWLHDARAFLHERCGDTVEMRAIAAAVGVHPVHLSRAFRRHFGVTMGEELRRLRVQRACETLVHTRHGLSRIALALGFSDHAHFTRVFKRHVGLTPTDFRRARLTTATRPAA